MAHRHRPARTGGRVQGTESIAVDRGPLAGAITLALAEYIVHVRGLSIHGRASPEERDDAYASGPVVPARIAASARQEPRSRHGSGALLRVGSAQRRVRPPAGPTRLGRARWPGTAHVLTRSRTVVMQVTASCKRPRPIARESLVTANRSRPNR